MSRDVDNLASSRRRASRADVAAHAGVSHGTVSHVLNHPEKVRPETRARVEAAIAELGFVRDEAARHLRAGYSTTIGLLLLDAWNPGFTEIARGVEEATADGPWTVLMSNSARDTARESRYLREYASRRVAGMIVIPNDDATEPLHQLWHADIPMVVVDRVETSPTALSVSVDDVRGGRLAAKHLLGLGHARIAFVGDPEAALPVRARFAGFSRAVRATPGVELEILPAPLTIDGGLAVGREIAARAARERPTAIATAVDLLAIGVLQSLLSEGVRVPGDISLVGYDDIPFTAQLSVPLTSVARPHRQMGIQAAELLLAMIDGTIPQRRGFMLQPELVVRHSTARQPGS